MIGEWLKAAHGLAPGRPLEPIFCQESFCQQTFFQEISVQESPGHDALILPDILSSSFREGAWVCGSPHLRAYLGVPLRTSDGYAIGTLWVLDRVPRPDFDSEAVALLGEFASLVQDGLELRLARSTRAAGPSKAPSDDGRSLSGRSVSGHGAGETRIDVQSAFHRELLRFTQCSLEVGLTEGFYQELLHVAISTIPVAQAGSLLVRDGTKHSFAAAVGYDLSALQACVFDEEEASTGVDLKRFEPQHIYSWHDDALTSA